MRIKGYTGFVSEMRRYLSGEFSNLTDFIGYLQGKYNFMESIIAEYPEIKNDIKKVLFYIEFPYKGEQKRVRLKFGPWVRVDNNSFAQWHGSLYSTDQKIVLSKKFFSPIFSRHTNYLAGVILHELVHSLDPKDRPFTGTKGDITIGTREQGKRLGFSSGISSVKEFMTKLIEYVIDKGIDAEKFYDASTEEYDAWISQLVFELELGLLEMSDKQREEAIVDYLDQIRQGKYGMLSGISGVDRMEIIERFSKADKKFTKRLLNSIYRSILDFQNLKRTNIKISVDVPDSVKTRLENVLSEEEYQYILTGMESM